MTYCLAIAGFDPSAGAGVLADLETFRALGIAGAAVLTAVTAQNRRRVTAVHPLPPRQIEQQLEALLREGRPTAVKIGMLGSAAAAEEVAALLGRLDDAPVVLDPVLRATAGAALLQPEGLEVLRRRLLPRATVITPNRAEAERLLGRKICGAENTARAARELLSMGPRAVVITAGDERGPPVDVLADRRGLERLEGRRVRAGRVRGTGCRHSSALAAYLARGHSVRRAARLAQSYVRRYLESR